MHPTFRAWAQLIRIPNTLTACADVIAGFAITAGAWSQSSAGSWPAVLPALVCVAAASICLYWAGMILNDVHDVEADRSQRRPGPLVDGRISISRAALVGRLLLLMGVCLASYGAYAIPKMASVDKAPWFVISTAVGLAVAIVAYDSRLKGTALGPLLMGLCRGLNISMGVFLGACIDWPVDRDWYGIASVVSGHIAFVVGVTLAARREGVLQQSKYRLASAWLVSLLGVAAFAGSSCWSLRALRLDPTSWYPLLVGMLMLPWMRRAMISIHHPGMMTLVPAIKQAILSIIFLDAAVTLQFANSVPGIAVCCLAIPTLALGRLFRMT